MEEKKYPIGGYAPGNYRCTCCSCGSKFTGDKRAVQCEPCATKSAEPNPELALVFRIVSNWGNAVEMQNMEQWLKDYAAARQPGTVWPLFVIDKYTGERHEVNKIVYHPENEPEPHVWCDTWYGHHIIGKDCEWAVQGAPAAGREEWIDVNDGMPEEAGRYWCYVKHLTDTGFSYFQWNCDYNPQLRRFSDMTLKDGEQITHWRPLPAPPKFKQQKEK